MDRRYHPLVLETADDWWTDDEGRRHPLCTCCYGCSGLTDDSEMWTCRDGLGCCDRRVVEQRVCSCRCHAAFVVAVRLDNDLDVVIAAEDERDGHDHPGCAYLGAVALLQEDRQAGARAVSIEWDYHRDVTTDANGKPCCRCHLGYERVDRAINAEWDRRFDNNEQRSKA